MSKTNRREFLINTVPLAAVPLLRPILPKQIVAGLESTSLWRLINHETD
jgi:hypothetical protein